MFRMLVMWSLIAGCVGSVSEPDHAQQIQGVWSVEPSEADKRQAFLLQLAFSQPPPDEQAIAEANLTDEEKVVVESLLQAQATAPDAPIIAVMRNRLAGMDSATFEITAAEMRFTLGGETEVRAYSVVSASESEVAISVVHPSGTSEEHVLQVRSPNELVLQEASGETTILHRNVEGG